MGSGSSEETNTTHWWGSYNFYRDYVEKSGYRVIYEISGDTMTVVAVLPKDDDTYDRVDLSNEWTGTAD